MAKDPVRAGGRRDAPQRRRVVRVDERRPQQPGQQLGGPDHGEHLGQVLGGADAVDDDEQPAAREGGDRHGAQRHAHGCGWRRSVLVVVVVVVVMWVSRVCDCPPLSVFVYSSVERRLRVRVQKGPARVPRDRPGPKRQ